MKVKFNEQEGASLLEQLRKAVALQIELWDVTNEMAAKLECYGLEEVTDRVGEMSITAGTGLELTSKDLDDFLGIGPVRTVTGKALPAKSLIQ